MNRWLLVTICLLGLGLPRAWAEGGASVDGGSDRVDQVMGRYNVPPALMKLARGASNALGGWLEIPVNVQQRYSTQDTAGSLLTGLGYGVIKGVVRTAVGVYEAVTFFLPYPEDFAPILPTLAYFQKDPNRQTLPFEY